MGADVIEKVAVVRNYQHRAEILCQKFLQPADSVNIEVVCRLVEKYYIGAAEKRLRQQYFYLFVAREGRHLRIKYILRKPQTLYQL